MHRRSKRGYILIETTVAMVVLGISSITIHGVVRQSILTRGQAQDFTQVRLLMEDYMARLELQPYLFPGVEQGTFDDGSGRFGYTHRIRVVGVPVPELPIPSNTPADEVRDFRYERDASLLVHVALTVRWKRGGMDFEETIETLLPQSKLYVPGQPSGGGDRNAQ
mgnify:CR=1 FL=1